MGPALAGSSDGNCEMVDQEVGICLLSDVAILPTPGVWGIHGCLLTLRLGSVLHVGKEGEGTACEMRSVMSLRCHVLCGIGN